MDAGKTALSVMGACAFGLTFVPHPLRAKLDACVRDLWEKLFSTADPFTYIEVPRKSKLGSNASVRHNANAYAQIAPTCNPFYSEVGLYLGSLNIEFATRRVCVYGMDLADDLDRSLSAASKFVFGLPLNETLIDTFEGAQFSWTHTMTAERKQSASLHGQNDDDANNVFTLRMLKSDKQHLLRPYLSHISRVAHEIRQQNTQPTLYTNGCHGSHWTPAPLKHPSTFHTIALDGDLAERIRADLKAFSESETYYHSIGRAWKRGYLLYGPPGTGKSSLIAAIANYMHYDIYDLELTNVFNNSGLQSLLMQTTRKSIIVIEDIDCATATGISERQKGEHEYASDEDDYGETPSSNSQGITLSGLLNFADGLLSCYGEERIFIFTTNHKERLDSALLRCGRMDMHIHLSYCTFSVFKKLAANYLGVKSHALYGELEEAMRAPGVKITPASIAEILISERKLPDEAIKQVLAAVKGGEPLDADGKEKLTAAGAKSGQPVGNTEANGRIRKYLDGDVAPTFCEGSPRKKRQAGVDVYAADLPTAKDTGLWSSGEEFEEEGRGIRTSAMVEEQMESGKDALLSRLQSEQARDSADEGVELPTGDKPEVIAPTNVAYGKGQFLDAGYDQQAGEAVQASSDMNASDLDGGVWQGMTIDDSEESSDEGSEKRASAHLIPLKAASSWNVLNKQQGSSEREIYLLDEKFQKHAEDKLEASQTIMEPLDIGNMRFRHKLRPRRIFD